MIIGLRIWLVSIFTRPTST